MSDPWFRFFPSDWISGVSGLSAAERGVYVTILAIIYDHGKSIARDDARLARMCGLPTPGFTRAVEALLSLGKLTETDGLIFNDRAKNELHERENRKLGASEAAASRWGKTKQKQHQNYADASNEQCEPNATRARIPQPQPQSLDKSKDTNSLRSFGEKQKSNRGSRLPADWMPDDAGRALAAELLGNSGARSELAKFRDWAASAAGAKGVKADWDAAWRNWVRKASEDAKPRAGPPRSDPQETRNPALRALQRLSQKNAQRTDSADIFSPDAGSGQRASPSGSPSSETGFATGGHGPVLDLAAYR